VAGRGALVTSGGEWLWARKKGEFGKKWEGRSEGEKGVTKQGGKG